MAMMRSNQTNKKFQWNLCLLLEVKAFFSPSFLRKRRVYLRISDTHAYLTNLKGSRMASSYSTQKCLFSRRINSYAFTTNVYAIFLNKTDWISNCLTSSTRGVEVTTITRDINKICPPHEILQYFERYGLFFFQKAKVKSMYRIMHFTQ